MRKPFPYLSVAGALGVIALAACSTATQQPPSGNLRPAAVGQPGRPPAAPAYTTADVHFMSGMISHHAQAVLMAGWAPSHGASRAVRAMCERIVNGQTDEIVLMQRWLRERHETVPPADPRGHMMPGMDHPMLMPGMLTPEQMTQLDSAKGPEFDRLFLTFMIMHHQGAITMVDQLFGSQGGGEEDTVFRFASDVYADQSTELDRMNRMLSALKRSPQ